jgi:four helix bundle protein
VTQPAPRAHNKQKNMEELNKYSYKTLNVYQDAKKFVVDVYKLLKSFPSEERYALCDQIRRAAISVTSNITEGTSRFSKKEKAHFLEIAYASLMEVDSQLDISVELEYISLEEYKSIHGQVCAISRQLSALRTTILS